MYRAARFGDPARPETRHRRIPGGTLRAGSGPATRSELHGGVCLGGVVAGAAHVCKGEAEEYFRASVEVKRGLGNQVGVSNSTFHLGRVAQLRGDLELAEQCYRKCLAIDEAEGAWTEVALD
ncbi:tetratricopeptide repeat protein [Streptomyces sp. NBC_01230]|uniref:tetratricopeptide repeat protein n=1 Tax=Streptomyces sp. NBC_01230 TaxID=2903784 RepID=UPI002E14E2C2|nr:tetratricopeptide repeat protein [Streptomyces sp. NBC_01230]